MLHAHGQRVSDKRETTGQRTRRRHQGRTGDHDNEADAADDGERHDAQRHALQSMRNRTMSKRVNQEASTAGMRVNVPSRRRHRRR